MKWQHNLMLITILLFSVYSINVSATVVWDEAVDGDSSGSGGTLISLVDGISTVYGSTIKDIENNESDFDLYKFSLGEYDTLLSLTFTVTNFTSSNNDWLVDRWSMMEPDGIHYLNYDNYVAKVDSRNNIRSYQFYFGTPLTNNNYSFKNFGTTRSANTSPIISYDYQIDFTLNSNPPGQQVPEPSAIALMGLGLLGFVASRRRQKRN